MSSTRVGPGCRIYASKSVDNTRETLRHGLDGSQGCCPGRYPKDPVHTAVRKLPERDLESSECDHQERLRCQRSGMPETRQFRCHRCAYAGRCPLKPNRVGRQIWKPSRRFLIHDLKRRRRWRGRYAGRQGSRAASRAAGQQQQQRSASDRPVRSVTRPIRPIRPIRAIPEGWALDAARKGPSWTELSPPVAGASSLR